MGREVVRKESPKDPGERSRLWHHEDCYNVLQNHTGTKKVEGLMIDWEMNEEGKSICSFEEYPGKIKRGTNANFKIGGLEKMTNLMLLQLKYITFSGEYKELPKNLRLLSWHGFYLESIPSDICLQKLVVLDMSYSKLKRVWDKFMFIGSLKILNLTNCLVLIETPDFDGLPGLESLMLGGCSSLIKVHDSIANLRELVLLDLIGCSSLRKFPCLPTSLVSLQIRGCQHFGVLGRVQVLDSIPSFFYLKNLDVSYCDLVDSSFSNEDWSSLVSLDFFTMDGNNVTCLPKCVQTLPSVNMIRIHNCSELQSIQGLPRSLHMLSITDNESLEKVQPASKIIVAKKNCPKLCDVEGHYMVLSADKVERKIIQYLGLETNAGEDMELGLKVLHEFGIFSTFVSERQIPSHFMYKEEGPQIAFFVPWIHDGSRISGFRMSAKLSLPTRFYLHLNLKTLVYNETKDLLWVYDTGDQERYQTVEKRAWLSLWRCGNLLEVGDEIVVHLNPSRGIVVEELCINLIYEDDEELDGERKEGHHIKANNQISWTNILHGDISNHVDKGGRHLFESMIWPH
ncbi:hypothetical protein L1887_04506 [Cichorium endivia]|nr:hypothetical protein L1887_04506 [Cichorium endivia]